MPSIIHNQDISENVGQKKEKHQYLPQINRKTIRLHIKKIIQSIQDERNKWTRGNIVRFMIKAVFWTPIYLLFGYLTISSSMSLIQQYQQNPIYLSMTAMINQPFVKLPNFTLCLYFNLTDVADTLDASNREDSSASYSEILKQFFEDNTPDGIFNFTQWPNTTNGVVVRYLIMMYEYETLRDPTESQFDFQQFQQTNDDYWAAVRTVLVPKIAEFNISLDQLKETFTRTYSWDWAHDIGCGYKIDTCIFSASVGDDCAPSNSISFIGRDSICMRFINIQMIIDQESFDQCLDMTINGFNEDGNVTSRYPFSLDFTGRSKPPPQTLPASETDYVFQFSNLSENYDVYLNITAVYRSQPGVNKTCSLDSTLEDCEHLCQSNLIGEFCGCTPITLNKLYDSNTISNCTLERYESCFNKLENLNQCREKCVPNCEKRLYEFDIRTTSIDRYQEIKLHLISPDYLIMEETYTWTFETFMGALGGAIAIWLGLDFVILIEIIFNPIMSLVRKLLTKTGGNEEEETENAETQQNRVLRKLVQISHEYGTSRSLIACWYFEKLFWIVIYVVGGIWTAIYCVDLIQQYASGATQYNAAILFNKSIILPDARLCFDLSQSPVRYAENANDVGKIMMLTQDLEKYFNQTTSREAFFNSSQAWPRALVFAAYQYIGTMTLFEWQTIFMYDLAFLPTSPNSDCWALRHEANDSQKEDMDIAYTTIFMPKLFEWNISIEELRQKVGQEIRNVFNLTLSFYESKTLQKLIVFQDLRTVYIDLMSICYHLPVSELVFANESDIFEISAETPSYCYLNGDNWLPGYPAIVVDFVDIDVVGYNGPVSSYYNNYNSIFTANYGETTNFSLGVDAYYSSLPVANGKDKCAVDNELAEKDNWLCIYAAILDTCNCIATAYPSMSPPPPPGVLECNWKSYNDCVAYVYYKSSFAENCTGSHQPPCKTWYFLSSTSWFTNETKLSDDGNADSTVVRFLVKGFIYTDIEEQRIFTFQKFLAAFGGMLGIWLGLSFFSLVRILSFPVELILGLLLRRFNDKFHSIIDPKKNLKLKKHLRSRWFLMVEYILNLKYHKLYREIRLPTVLTRALMAPFFITGIVETAAMCINLYQEYRCGKTSSSVTFMKNETFTLPPSTLCLPTDFADFSIFKAEQKPFLEESLTEITGMYKTKETLLNSNWSNSFLQLPFEYLSLLSQVERNDNVVNFLRKSLVENDEGNPRIFLNSLTAISSFEYYIWSLNLSVEELKQKCGREFKKIIHIDVKNFSEINGSSSSLDLIKETTFIGERTICYKLRLDAQVFSSKTESLSLFFKRELLPDIEKNSSLTIGLSGRDNNLNQGWNKNGSILTANFGEEMETKIRIKEYYVASSFSNGVEKCSQEKRLEDCQDDCRINTIQKYCNCTPVSWSKLALKSGEFCSLDNYVNCFQVSSNSGQNYLNFQGDLTKCSSRCLPFCTVINYEEEVTTGPRGVNEVEVVIKINSFPYFVYSEHFSYNFISFVSEFGGDLGIWVGLDFLIITEIFVSVFCILLRLILILIRKAAIPGYEEIPAESMVQVQAAHQPVLPLVLEESNNFLLVIQGVPEIPQHPCAPCNF